MTCCLKEAFIIGEIPRSKENISLDAFKAFNISYMLKSSSSPDCLSGSDLPE